MFSTCENEGFTCTYGRVYTFSKLSGGNLLNYLSSAELEKCSFNRGVSSGLINCIGPMCINITNSTKFNYVHGHAGNNN